MCDFDLNFFSMVTLLLLLVTHLLLLAILLQPLVTLQVLVIPLQHLVTLHLEVIHLCNLVTLVPQVRIFNICLNIIVFFLISAAPLLEILSYQVKYCALTVHKSTKSEIPIKKLPSFLVFFFIFLEISYQVY